MNLEEELEKKYLKAERLKTVKNLEKEYTKDLIKLYKEKLECKAQENEFNSVVEMYKAKIQEIEYLKNKKEEILQNYHLAAIETDKKNLILENYLKEIEKKKADFDKFMKEKGKEALIFVKRNAELKKKLQEELHKYENKKKVKATAVKEAKSTVENFRTKEMLIREKELNDLNSQTESKVLYKINQTFHNFGNKIDYSTTRFHNVTVIKHTDELNLNDYISAQEKAIKETENLKIKNKTKESLRTAFNNETSLNSKEIIRRERAKENLKRLNEELNEINKNRKKSTSKNKMLPNGNMIQQAKHMEKNSSKMMEQLLKERMTQRKQFLNNRKNDVLVQEDEINVPDDISDFYREEDEQIEEDKYLNEAMIEHNRKIDEKKKTIKKEYEEPITRELKIQEEIGRLNPVDIQSFQISQGHIKSNSMSQKPIVKMMHKKNTIPDIKNDQMIANFNDLRSIIKSGIHEPPSDYSLDPTRKNKANNMVMEFFNDIQKIEEKVKVKETPYLYVEEKFKMDHRKINEKSLGNQLDVNNLNNINSNKNTVKNYSQIPTHSEKVNIKENINPLHEDDNDKKIEDEFKRDEGKWKYSKQELYEKRKKLLKDKSTIKK